MPPEDCKTDFILKCRTPTGEWQEFPDYRPVPVNLIESIDFAEGADVIVYPKIVIHGDDAIEITGSFICPPEIRKRLSRKRLKKILMSFGVPRNMAEKQSRECVRQMPPFYREALVAALFYKVLMGDWFDEQTS